MPRTEESNEVRVKFFKSDTSVLRQKNRWGERAGREIWKSLDLLDLSSKKHSQILFGLSFWQLFFFNSSSLPFCYYCLWWHAWYSNLIIGLLAFMLLAIHERVLTQCWNQGYQSAVPPRLYLTPELWGSAKDQTHSQAGAFPLSYLWAPLISFI